MTRIIVANEDITDRISTANAGACLGQGDTLADAVDLLDGIGTYQAAGASGFDEFIALVHLPTADVVVLFGYHSSGAVGCWRSLNHGASFGDFIEILSDVSDITIEALNFIAVGDNLIGIGDDGDDNVCMLYSTDLGLTWTEDRIGVIATPFVTSGGVSLGGTEEDPVISISGDGIWRSLGGFPPTAWHYVLTLAEADDFMDWWYHLYFGGGTWLLICYSGRDGSHPGMLLRNTDPYLDPGAWESAITPIISSGYEDDFYEGQGPDSPYRISSFQRIHLKYFAREGGGGRWWMFGVDNLLLYSDDDGVTWNNALCDHGDAGGAANMHPMLDWRAQNFSDYNPPGPAISRRPVILDMAQDPENPAHIIAIGWTYIHSGDITNRYAVASISEESGDPGTWGDLIQLPIEVSGDPTGNALEEATAGLVLLMEGGSGGGGGFSGGDIPEQDPARPKHIGPDGVLLDVDPLDLLNTQCMRPADGWYLSTNKYERALRNQRRYNLLRELWQGDLRWPSGLLIEPATEQHVTSGAVFNAEHADWAPFGTDYADLPGIFKQRDGTVIPGKRVFAADAYAAIWSAWVALPSDPPKHTGEPETLTIYARKGTAPLMHLGTWDYSGPDTYLSRFAVNMTTGATTSLGGSNPGTCYAKKVFDLAGAPLWKITLTVIGVLDADREFFFAPGSENGDATVGEYTDFYYMGWERKPYGSNPLSAGDIAGETFWHPENPDPRPAAYYWHGVLLCGPGPTSWIWRIGGDDGGIGLRIIPGNSGSFSGQIEAVLSLQSGGEYTSTLEVDWAPGDEVFAMVTVVGTGKVLLTLSINGSTPVDADPSEEAGIIPAWDTPEGTYFEVEVPILHNRLIVVRLEAMANLPGVGDQPQLPLWELLRLEKRLSMFTDVI